MLNLRKFDMKILRLVHLTWEIQKSHFQQYYSYILLIIYVISEEEKSCHPLAHPTWNCHHINLWTAKLFHLTEGLLHSFKRWKLSREPVVGCHQWLWKGPVVVCGNWNVRQATSQQVFRVTTFCINTCFQSSLTLISSTVHHTVLKFSPHCNKLLSRASTCPYQYTRSSCPRRSTRAMQLIGSTKQQ